MKNLWKWILGIIGAVFFILMGVNMFSGAQDERAWKKYKKDKEEFDKIRKGLDAQNEADKQKLEEIEKQKAEAEKAFLKRSSESKEEAAKIENMDASALADFTTKKEEEIRKRLGM
jgi:sortase (surface protein transpeptidase)